MPKADREKRKHRRRQLDQAGWIRPGDGSSVYCVIEDVSDARAKPSGGGVREAP